MNLDPSTPVNLHNRLSQPISSNEIQNPLMTLLEFWGIFQVLGFYLSLGGGNHEYVLGLGVTRDSQHPVEVGKVFMLGHFYLIFVVGVLVSFYCLPPLAEAVRQIAL